MDGWRSQRSRFDPPKTLIFGEKMLIVTTSTTPKHQNEDEDGDGDAVLRHVAAYVDDVTSL